MGQKRCFYDKMIFMKQKRFAFLAGILGLGGLAAAGVVARQKQLDKERQQILVEVREFFAPFGKISVVYINDFESIRRLVTGGVVFEDGVTFYFSYDHGDINYRLEEDLDK